MGRLDLSEGYKIWTTGASLDVVIDNFGLGEDFAGKTINGLMGWLRKIVLEF